MSLLQYLFCSLVFIILIILFLYFDLTQFLSLVSSSFLLFLLFYSLSLIVIGFVLIIIFCLLKIKKYFQQRYNLHKSESLTQISNI
jgi:hypothetical protein